MPLPDINTTIASALYGATRGMIISRSVLETPPAEGADAAETVTPTEGVTAPVVPADAASLGADWDSAPAAVRTGFLTMARFLNSYSHGTSVAKLDRASAGMALVGAAKNADLHQFSLPYAVLVEVFVSVKQALS